MDEALNNINQAIDKIKNKDCKIIFLSPDTKGLARAAVSYIYRQASVLKNAGYQVSILTEKNDYIKPSDWLSGVGDELEHFSIEDNKLTVGPQDYVVIPEIYGTIFEQIQQLPMDKIVLVQNYEYLLDSFAPGKSWLDYGVFDCITTSNIVAENIAKIVGGTHIDFVAPYISHEFKPSELPQTPVIAIHCRDQRKAAKIIKSFYLKYPLYRFVSFKDMHGMSEWNFAENLKECALSVWIDADSTFGTYPIESIKCNIPVIGKIPNIIPEWMTDDNGIWVYDDNEIPDLIFSYIKNWMEDSLPQNLTNVAETMKDLYTKDVFEKATIDTYTKLFERKIDKLNKIKTNFETKPENNEE